MWKGTVLTSVGDITSPTDELHGDEENEEELCSAGAHTHHHTEARSSTEARMSSNEARRSALLVVVTLITTLSFSIATNPPGGSWQDDSGGHVAGTAIMMSKDPVRYGIVMVANWLCFYSSLLLIFWLLIEKESVRTRLGLFKAQFSFCIGGLLIVFLASQTKIYLPWALITLVLMSLFAGASVKCASK